jgi:RimJ/RimL family protein N-acetyltransferase
MLSPNRDVKTSPVLKLVLLNVRHARRLATLAGDDSNPPWTIVPERSPLQNVLAFVARAQRLRARGAHDTFAIFDADRLVGVAVLARDPTVPDHAELGYWIAEHDRSRGYATAAARQLLDKAFGRMNLALVFARCPGANRASCRVLEKLRFRFIASEPWQSPTSGAEPVRRYELTCHEWRRSETLQPTSAQPRQPP